MTIFKILSRRLFNINEQQLIKDRDLELDFNANVPSNRDHAKTELLTHPKYRPDIDGLRAIAVISVVIFHAFPGVLVGGFIGVDIFFIISGFLISSIIIDNLEHERFSFIEFYSRRIKRIYPALLLVLIVCFAFGWFTLFADEYKQLGKHIAGGAAFVSNFVLSNESGYFNNSSETKILLHLWSLGVEEQFYIVWPLLVWACLKRRFNFLVMAVGMTIISFAVCHYTFNRNLALAFYSPQTRFWELLMGSILAYVNLHRENVLSGLKNQLKHMMREVGFSAWSDRWESAQSILGFILIIIGLVYITKASPFPGWLTLLPTLGAIFIISGGHRAWPNRTILSNPVMLWFGLISYPLYLWHWPILSYTTILNGGKPSAVVCGVAIIISILLSWLTYELVENPIRTGKNGKVKTMVLILVMVMIGCAGYVTYREQGFGFRLGAREVFFDYFENGKPEERYFEKIELRKKVRDECDFYDNFKDRYGHATNIPLEQIADECYVRDSTQPHAVFLWGDSHAQQLYPGLKEYLPASWQILQVTTSGCNAGTDIRVHLVDDACHQANRFALNAIAETKPDVVIIAQDHGQISEGFDEIAAKLKNMNIKKIILMGPTPHWTSDFPRILARKLWPHTPRRTYVGIDQQMQVENVALQSTFKSTDSVIEVNLIGFFCNKEGCLTYVGDDVRKGIVSYDYGHLTPVASAYLAKHLLADLITGKQAETK